MTAPRIPLFQRKGGPPPSSGDPTPAGKPSVVIAIGHGGSGPKGQPADDGGPDAGQGAKDDTPVQCPNCGCTFDPATGEPVGDQGDQGQGAGQPGPPPGADGGGAPPGDVSEKLKAMMGAASGGS